jgi:GAF domain-containing protein/ActR/RegA family two-component response regulator
VAAAVETARLAVEQAQQALRREARILAQDPAVVEGVARNDWATLARGASPRLTSLTVDRIADLVLVVDGAGAPLVQVPATPRPPAAAALAPPPAVTGGVQTINGRVYVVGVAPVFADGRGAGGAREREGTALGAVVAGRRIDRVAAGSALVALAGDRLLGASLRAAPAAGWETALRAGAVAIAGQSFSVRPLPAAAGGLVTLVPDAEYRSERRRLALGLGVSLALFVVGAGGAAWARGRRPERADGAAPPGGSEAPAPPPETSSESERRRLDTLVRLSRALTGTLALDVVLQRVVNATVEVFGCSNASLWLVEEGGRALTVPAFAGDRSDLPDRMSFEVGEGLVGWIAAHRTALTVPDVFADPRTVHVERLRDAGVVSLAGVPLLVGDRLLGVLAITLRQQRAYDLTEVGLLQSFADHAAIAIDTARRFGEESARRAHFRALLEINARIGAMESTDDLLVLIAEEAARLLEVDNAGFRLVEGDELVLAGLAGTARQTMLKPRLKIGESLSGRVVAEGRPQIVDLAERGGDMEPTHLAADQSLGYRSYLGVPLRVGNRIIGVLTFRARRPFTSREQELAEAFAGQAAVAIEHARLYREATRQAERMRALADVERLLSETLAPEVVVQRVADSISTLLGARSAILYRVDTESGMVETQAISTGSEFPWTRVLPSGTGMAGVAIRDRRPVRSPDVLFDERIPYTPEVRAVVEKTADRALLAVPVFVRGSVFGALAVAHTTGRIFDDEEVRLAEAFAAQAATAIENARLYSLETSRRAQLAALAEVERDLAAELNLDRLLRLIIERASRLFAAQGTIYLVDDGGTLTAAAVSEQTPAVERLAFGAGLVGTCAERCEGMIVNDYRASAFALPRFVALGVRHAMAQPLVSLGRLMGVIALFRADAVKPFSAEDLEILGSFANQAAIAIQNARLYDDAEQRRREAEELARMARVLTETLDVATVGDRIVESVRAMFGVDSAGLRVLEPDGSLVAVAWRGSATAFFAPGHRQPAASGLLGRALAEGRPLWSRDLLADDTLQYPDDMRRRVVGSGQRAALAVPLRAKGRTVGGLFLAHSRPRTFSEAEVALAQAVGDQAALALENARLREEAERRRRAAEQLAELGRLVSQSLEPERVGQPLAERIRETFGARRAALYRVIPDGEALEAVGFSDAAGAALRDDARLPQGLALIGRAVAERRAVSSPDVLTDPDLRYTEEMRARIEAGQVRAAMAAPLFVGDAVIGVLGVGDRAGRVFTEEEITLLEACADRAAVALDNARLYSETARRQREAEALARLGQTLTESLDVAAVADRIVESLLALFDAQSSILRLLQPDGSVVTLATAGRARVHYPPGLVTPAGVGLIARAIAEGRALWSSDRFDDPTIVLTEETRARGLAAGVRAALVAPLRVKGRIIGALSVSDDRRRSFTDAEVVLGQSFADQAALALENARLYEETEQRLEETRALLEVAALLNSTLDPKQLLKRVTIKIAQVCRVDRCSIEVWEGDRVVPLMSQFADGRRRPDLWGQFTRLQPTGVRDVPAHVQVIETRRPVVIDDTTSTTLIPREWIDAYGLRSYMVVPLIHQDQVIGAMNLDHCERAAPFSPSQVDLAVGVAGQLALALENTRLYTEVQERLRETTALLAVARVLSQTGPLAERLRQVAREVAHALEASCVGVYGVDEAREALLPIAGYRVPKNLLQFFFDTPLLLAQMPGAQAAWRAGRTVTSPDGHADFRFHPDLFTALDPCSVMWTPTRVRGEPVGGIYALFWGTGREFRPAEVRVLEGIAAQVGLALENAELTRQTEIKLHETETLLSVSRALTSTLDLQAMLREFLRTMARVFGADSVGVWLVADDDDQVMVPVQGYRVPPERIAVLRDVRLSIVDHPIYAEGARTRRPVFVADTSIDPRAVASLLTMLPHTSHLFVPIVAKDRFIGGFVAVWYERRAPFSASELTLLEAIAHQAGLGIDNARLFEQNRRQVEELSVLHEMSRAVTGQFDRAALLATIHAQVVRVLEARHLVILLADGDELTVVLRVEDGVPNTRPPLRYARGTVGLASVVRETGRPLRTRDYRAECAERGVAAVAAAPTLPCWLGVPMSADGSVLGVIALRRADRPYTEADERFLANLADLGALALRSARLFEERSRAYGELAAAQDHLVRTEKLRALGEMASGVAHDFNNLLAAILGRAQLVLARVEDPTLVRWLQVIERSALDGAQTVRRLQEFARIRRDQSFEVVDVNEIVRDALEITQSRWREASLRQGVLVEVHTSLPPVPEIAGDPAELREALTNLILNALDAMPTGGTLTIASRAGGDAVEVTVTDTGVGIPAEVREKIFDPFFTTKGPQGTGLGLSMTYGILSRHGARIAVESEAGHGTTFRLTFPLGAGQAAAPDIPPGTVPTAATGLRCLVVDDEEPVATVLADMLEAVGHTACYFTDPAAAVERVRTESFDVVFTDLAMPGMTGWQVARAVKEMAPALPVFVVTGFGVELSNEERRAHGVTAVLAKPLKIDDVVSVLAQVERARSEPRAEE